MLLSVAHDGSMHIREIRVTDDEFADWFVVYQAASTADDPTGPRWRELEVQVSNESTDYREIRLWLAEDNGRTVGAASLRLPLTDNPHLGIVELYTRPDHRRKGVGTALLERIEQTARERNRGSLLAYASAAIDAVETPGSRFAEHHGFTMRMTEARRVQRAPFPLDAIAAAVAEAKAHSAEYEIVTWCDFAPAEYAREQARLEGRMSTDAPLGDLEYQAEVWDEDRLRLSVKRHKQMGQTIWVAAALAPDGSMAGMTQLALADESDRDGVQDSTIVDPRHRGHRLGIVLKAANLERVLADRPGIEEIWTWNADSNTHMIAVNEIMGYTLQGWDRAYQRDVRS